MKLLAKYRKPDLKRSVIEIVVTVVPLMALWAAAWAALSVSYWLTLAILIPAAFLLVRLFIIQHDCGHGGYFQKPSTNDWVGRVLGVFTCTPYDVWRRSHAIHHATSGNLDKRGVGDIDTLTISEYHALPRWRQIVYRLYRHPVIMFGVGPAYLFLLEQRLPSGMLLGGWRPWLSAMGTNVGIAIFTALMMWLVGWKAFLMVHLPLVALSASIGVWLFYIQHQFEDTYWAEGGEWSHLEAALHGSSHYDLPPILRWATGNIGIHHVHHLYSRIPFYRLPDVLRDFPELAGVRRVTLWESFKYARLRLWDQAAMRLVPIAEVTATAAAR
ncbi:MAG: fatty acid desaturase [Alphaproteobacteria bacterium]|nr:fatty acid desaturase [Alphaproteobacteria bacterium]